MAPHVARPSAAYAARARAARARELRTRSTARTAAEAAELLDLLADRALETMPAADTPAPAGRLPAGPAGTVTAPPSSGA